MLKEKSKGQIVITHHYGASLGYKSKDQFDAVTDGALPIADTYVGPLRGIHPIFLLSSLPFLARTIDDAKSCGRFRPTTTTRSWRKATRSCFGSPPGRPRASGPKKRPRPLTTSRT